MEDQILHSESMGKKWMILSHLLLPVVTLRNDKQATLVIRCLERQVNEGKYSTWT